MKSVAPGAAQRDEYYFVALFWLVERTEDESEANVNLRKKNGIPVLTNPRKIEVGDTLKRFVPPVPAERPAKAARRG